MKLGFVHLEEAMGVGEGETGRVEHEKENSKGSRYFLSRRSKGESDGERFVKMLALL